MSSEALDSGIGLDTLTLAVPVRGMLNRVSLTCSPAHPNKGTGANRNPRGVEADTPQRVFC